ncbi:MAG: CPBP family intramembrane metalloprotease [Clostridiales bacterium]|nr:CPBP family intramembrane metalloprotease [Clostridiales bacterium]
MLFGFMHTGNFATAGLIGYIVCGIILAAFYLKTKDLRKVIMIHALYNAAQFIFIPVIWLLNFLTRLT